MYKRPKIEDYIHDPDRNGSDGCTVVFYQYEEEEYLEALEKYCDFLESIGGTQVLLRAREEEIEELKFFNIAEVELDNISPPIRPVVKRFIEQNS